MEKLLSVKNLSRQYGPLTAVNNICFQLQRGEVLGFLGPNGAGKSTTMQMITGNLAPTTGEINLCGHDLLEDPKQAKANIGYLPEQPPLYRELTVNEYLLFCAQLNRIAKDKQPQAIQYAKQRCGLEKVADRLINNLSKGYQQRVGIAQAIIHSPAIVVLDEPTVGLDPIQIREIRSLIRELAEDHGVILSTHILPEVQMTCDRVQIINQGQLVYSDEISKLNQQMESSSLVLGIKQPPALSEIEAVANVTAVEEIAQQRFRISHQVGQSPAGQLAELAAKNNWGLFELSPETKTLEQVFVELTSSDMASTDITTEATETDNGDQAA